MREAKENVYPEAADDCNSGIGSRPIIDLTLSENNNANSLTTEIPNIELQQDQKSIKNINIITDYDNQAQYMHTSVTPEIQLQDIELQEKLLCPLINNKLDEFVDLLKDPNVNKEFNYTRPPHTYYGTCIEIASRLPNRGKFVKALLMSGVKPNVQDVHLQPIHYAAREGNPDALQALLQDSRTKINASDSFDQSALHFAVKYSRKEQDENYNQCITLLLKCIDFDVNKINKKGYTAIHEAVNSSKEAVALFLKYRNYDLDLDSSKVNGKSAREFITYKYPELRGLLPSIRPHKQLSDVNIQLNLLCCLQHRRLKEFIEILREIDIDGNARVDPNFCYGNPHNATCLQIASKEDDCSQFVKQLLKAGADPNIGNTITEKTPLHSAAELGNYKVLSELLGDRRTNVNAVDSNGKTVLHIIAQSDQESNEKENILKCLTLIFKKRKVQSDRIPLLLNLYDYNHKTAAQIALENGNKEILELMLIYVGNQMNLDELLKSDNEKLSDAIRKKFPDLETNISIHNDNLLYELSPILFQLLYDKKIKEFVKLLHSREEEENIDMDDGNYNLLQYATHQGLKEPIRELLTAGVNPNATTNYEKRPPIIIATATKNHEVLRLLLEMAHRVHLDINSEDAKGNTALHYASKNGDLESVVDLMSHGANFRHTNVFGKLPLPANSVKYFLDNSLKTNGKYPDDEEYALIFDYKFLLAYMKENSEIHTLQEEEQPKDSDVESNNVRTVPADTFHPEMDFLFYMSKSKEYKEIIEHPVITSFLHIKWRRVIIPYYLNLFINVLFVLLLNAFIILDPVNDDKNNMVTDNFLEIFDPAVRICLWIFVVYFFIKDLSQKDPGNFCSKFYILSLHNILDLLLTFFLTVRLLGKTPVPDWVVVIVILLSWYELILLTGRHPKLSKNIQMLKTVFKNYFCLFFSYIFLIIAFSFSFYSILHKYAVKEMQNNMTNNSISESVGKNGFYTTPWLSVLKIFAMMMGEFESNNLLPHVNNDENNITYLCLFSLFVFLISMIVFNLLIGVAVYSVLTVNENPYQLRLIAKIRLIHEIENSKSYRLIRPFLCCYNSFMRDVCLFPQATSNNKQIYIYLNKGPEVIFDDGSCAYCDMDSQILRKSLQIVSNNHKYKNVFNMSTNLQNQDTTIKTSEKLATGLNDVNEILRHSLNDRQELMDILKTISDILSKIKKE